MEGDWVRKWGNLNPEVKKGKLRPILIPDLGRIEATDFIPRLHDEVGSSSQVVKPTG